MEKKMKKSLEVLAVVILVLAFAGTQALAEQTEKGRMSSTGQKTETSQATFDRASNMIGLNVKNDQGQDLGKVEDIVINKNGRAQYLVLSQGGVMGIGNKLIPIPFQPDQIKITKEAVILSNIDKQKLAQAPSFSKDEWQNIEQPQFEQKVYGYYGQEQPAGKGMEQNQMQQQKSKSQGMGSQDTEE